MTQMKMYQMRLSSGMFPCPHVQGEIMPFRPEHLSPRKGESLQFRVAVLPCLCPRPYRTPYQETGLFHALLQNLVRPAEFLRAQSQQTAQIESPCLRRAPSHGM